MNDISLTVDPRVVSDSSRRFAEQILGTRIVKINRLDVEGTYRFTIPTKVDELIDLDGSFIYQRMRIVGVNDDDKSTREIPKATITYEDAADPNDIDPSTGSIKVIMKFEGWASIANASFFF